MSKALHVPLDPQISELRDIPYTIAFVIKKRQQIDNLNQLPDDKRPPEWMIWDSPPEEIEEWLDRVSGKKPPDTIELEITESEIE
jgi:hypothetical protein